MILVLSLALLGQGSPALTPLLATDHFSVLPSAAPEETDSKSKLYLYWVRDGKLVFRVSGLKVAGRVWFDPDRAENQTAKRKAYETGDGSGGTVGPLAKNQGLDLNKSKSHGYEAQTPAGKDFVHRARTGAVDHQDIRITIYGGSDADRDKVLADLKSHPALAPYRGRLAIQSYEAGHWAVDPALGFPLPGTPTIMIQDTDGYEVWRAENYSVGPDGLAKALAECTARKKDPDYDPTKTPGPNRRGAGGCPLGFTTAHLPLVAFALVICGWLLLGEKQS